MRHRRSLGEDVRRTATDEKPLTIEDPNDVAGLRRIGSIVARVLDEMLSAARAGMTTRELDVIGERLLEHYGARSAPRITYDFPGATCISVNEQAAHGIPGDRVLQEGDVVNVDVSAELDGYFADTGGTTVLPPSTATKTRLCHAARTALSNALSVVRAGRPLNGIGTAIEKTAKLYGFRVIQNLGSHGVGRALHEEPKSIAGYHDPSDQRVLHEGLVITIEPFMSTKSRLVTEAGDGWTLVGAQGNLSAQFEHTLIVTRAAPIIVTTY